MALHVISDNDQSSAQLARNVASLPGCIETHALLCMAPTEAASEGASDAAENRFSWFSCLKTVQGKVSLGS